MCCHSKYDVTVTDGQGFTLYYRQKVKQSSYEHEKNIYLVFNKCSAQTHFLIFEELEP